MCSYQSYHIRIKKINIFGDISGTKLITYHYNQLCYYLFFARLSKATGQGVSPSGAEEETQMGGIFSPTVSGPQEQNYGKFGFSAHRKNVWWYLMAATIDNTCVIRRDVWNNSDWNTSLKMPCTPPINSSYTAWFNIHQLSCIIFMWAIL